MNWQPTDGQIEEFLSFTGSYDKAQASRFLSREGSLEKAVQAFFDADERGTTDAYGPPQYTGWSENEMHAGKEYGPQAKPHNSYEIHSTDNAETLGPDIFNPLSRPPSRVDLKLDDKEDTEMQHGLMASIHSSRNGKTGSGLKPATGHHYAGNQWALTTTSQRVLPDPEPKNRARLPGSPAFIKPSTDEDRIHALLTIYQQIALAREALLARDSTLPEYGTSSDWWSGETINSRGIIVSTEHNEPVESHTPIVNEIQRLMAFLELTDRAYGSSDALKEIMSSSKFRPFISDNEADAHLLSIWRDECHDSEINETYQEFFTSTAYEKSEGKIVEEPIFRLFKLTVQYGTDLRTLYDVIDEILWGLWIVDAPTENGLAPGEILTFQMTQNSNESGGITGSIEWPLVFYTDRYLEANTKEAIQMLFAQAKIEEDRNDLQVQQNRLENVVPNTGRKGIAATDLLKVVGPFLAGIRPPVDELEGRDEVIASGLKYHPIDEYKKMGELLQKVADGVLKKHEALEKEKAQLDAKKAAVTDLLKHPTGDPHKDPTHRYTLRGVSVDQNTTYVLANPNSVDDLLETEAQNWDWWRIYWDSQSDSPADIRKVEAEDVQEAARKSEYIVAVYASDKAVEHQRLPLPDSLKNFVRADNLHFQAELDNPEISSKRKAESDDWSQMMDHTSRYNYNTQSRTSSVDSMKANMDVEMNTSFLSNFDENYPRVHYEPSPPEQVDSPSRPSFEKGHDIINDDLEVQETGVVNLMDDDTGYEQEMEEIDSQPLGVVPGGTSAGVGDPLLTNGLHSSDSKMSDVGDTQADDLLPSSQNQNLKDLTTREDIDPLTMK